MEIFRTIRKFLTYCILACCGLLMASLYLFSYSRQPTRTFTSFRYPSAQQPSTAARVISNVSADMEKLGHILDNKLKAVSIKRIKRYRPTCDTQSTIANSCDNNTCLQTQLPEEPAERVKQLIAPSQLQMSLKEHEILREMADIVEGNYEVILLTAASSNHFLESQALMKNLHDNLFPYLNNFTLIFYNLGLTSTERHIMVKYCKCRVLDFPFHKFPLFMTTLKCYAWKPVVIKAHLQKATFVFWMDASIRFYNASEKFFNFLQLARERGVQIGGSSADSSFRTCRSMYHFFGDEPCAYLRLGQARATFGIYHREYFVDRVILEPWVACAVQKECICPDKQFRPACQDSKKMATEYYQGNGNIVYGLCHRFDQSALSLIIHKLYQDAYRWVLVDIDFLLSIKRRDTLVYFPQE